MSKFLSESLEVPSPRKVEKLSGLGAAVLPARAAKPVQTSKLSMMSLKAPKPLLSQIPKRGANAWIRQTTEVLLSVCLTSLAEFGRGVGLTSNSGDSESPVQPTPGFRITRCDSAEKVAAETYGISRGDGEEDKLDYAGISDRVRSRDCR